MVYSEQCSGNVEDPPETHRCSPMIRRSRTEFENRSIALQIPEKSTQILRNNDTTCTQKRDEDQTICNCCSDYLVNCASQHIKTAKRLLNDKKLFDFDSECDTAQKCSKKVSLQIRFIFYLVSITEKSRKFLAK